MKYVVMQYCYTIYGVGDTREEAIADAAYWLGHEIDVDEKMGKDEKIEYVNKVIERDCNQSGILGTYRLVCSDDEVWQYLDIDSDDEKYGMKITRDMIKNCNDYLDNLNLTDNDLIRAGVYAGYPEEIVTALVYSDDVEQVVANFVND